MRHLVFIVVALVVGLLVGGYFVAPAGGQVAQVPGYQFPVDSLPPHPSQIVNLTGVAGPLAPGTSTPIYQVPVGSWLVVTDARLRETGGETRLDLIEVFGGTTTTKISWQFIGGTNQRHDSRVGWTFRPGSTVGLFNPDTANISGRYIVTGYLVRR